MKKIVVLATVSLAMGASAPLLAQAAKPATAKPAAAPAELPISKEQRDHAVEDFGILSSAIRSDKVPDDVKSALMGCIYSNPLEKISTAIDKVSADNPGKVDRNNPDSVLGAMAAICGYRPPAGAAAGAATPPPAATPPKATKGAATGR